MNFFNFGNKQSQVPELGVELELEGSCPGFSAKKHLPKKLYNKYILQQTIDDSVHGDGTEIIFKHYPLNHWDLDDIALILNTFRKYKLRPGPTAGMHIHFSCPRIEEIYKIHDRDMEIIYHTGRPGFMTNVLSTIGARQGHFNGAYVAGVNEDAWDRKHKDQPTIEIRTFESTTVPTIFYLRLSVVNYLMNYLAHTNYQNAEKNLFKDMPTSIKNQYYLLSIANNPNRYGWRQDVVTQKLFSQNEIAR